MSRKSALRTSARAGEFCTITSSNIEAIQVGSKIIYARRRSDLAEERYRPRSPGTGQQQGVWPLRTRLRELCRVVHILGRHRKFT